MWEMKRLEMTEPSRDGKTRALYTTLWWIPYITKAIGSHRKLLSTEVMSDSF